MDHIRTNSSHSHEYICPNNIITTEEVIILIIMQSFINRRHQSVFAPLPARGDLPSFIGDSSADVITTPSSSSRDIKR